MNRKYKELEERIECLEKTIKQVKPAPREEGAKGEWLDNEIFYPFTGPPSENGSREYYVDKIADVLMIAVCILAIVGSFGAVICGSIRVMERYKIECFEWTGEHRNHDDFIDERQK